MRIITLLIHISLLLHSSSSFQYTTKSKNISVKSNKSRNIIITRIHLKVENEDNNNKNVVDALIIEDNNSSSSSNNNSNDMGKEKDDKFLSWYQMNVNNLLKWLASLSLKDYQWRSDLFKRNEANRMESEFLATMRGDTAPYVRPMDAENKGPLGDLETRWVSWLSSVFETEAQRAQKIADGDGTVVRPMDIGSGPLSDIEKQAVDFLNSIQESERERVVLGLLRPMDLEESKRGPLGAAEANAVTRLKAIVEAERIRAQQSRQRGGTVVRPIDVPGPLGEFEKTVLDLCMAEKERKKESDKQGGKLVRPMDSARRSVLGDKERELVESLNKVRAEETERLQSIQRALYENRPMEIDSKSFQGVIEAFFVGIARGPRLLVKVFDRVNELLNSEILLSAAESRKSQDYEAPTVDDNMESMSDDKDDDDVSVTRSKE